jgi:hypothetical protein
MNAPFVPLIPAAAPAPQRAEFRVAVVHSPENLRPFQPLGGVGQHPADAEGRPQVTVRRDGQRVSAIHIQCRCGQVIELACVYET